MSIGALRFMLAATTRPATQSAEEATGPLTLLLLLAAVLALPLTLRIIRLRHLHQGLLTPEPPEAPGKTDTVGMIAALMLGFALPVIVGAAMFQALGGHPVVPNAPAEATLAAQRLAIMIQPATHVATIAGVLGMLMLTVPAGVAAVHLRFDRIAADLRQGISGYLLALPWVLLISAIVAVIVKWLGVAASTEHEVFTLWRAEAPGVTSLKLVMFLGAAILAPVAEELFFRGLLQTLILRVFRMPALAIVVASIAFASMHRPWPLQPPILVLSLAIGWTYFRSRSLLAAIFLHIVFNALQFALFLSMA